MKESFPLEKDKPDFSRGRVWLNSFGWKCVFDPYTAFKRIQDGR